MMNFILNIISSAICTFTVLYIGSKSYDKKIKPGPKNIIMISIYMLYVILSMYITITEKSLAVIFAYTMLMILYKIVYNENYNKSIYGAFLVYILMFISEIISGVGITIVSNLTKIDIINKVNIIVTVVIMSLMIIIFHALKPYIKKTLKNEEKYKTRNNIIIYALLFLTTTMIINKIYKDNWLINYELIINVLIFIVFLGILVYINKQNEYNGKIKAKYSELAEYMKLNDELLEDYRMKSHEFSNQLAIIKIMCEENDKEIKEYLNTLIEKNKKHKFSWINEIKYIQLAGLKGLMNYKIMEIKNLNIKLDISISKNVKKFTFDNFTSEEKDDLYSIIGVYLDNAKDAAKESAKKHVVIDIYMEEKDLVITIGNTYSGTINMDKIGEYNYSTKGGKHGIGLYLVENIIKLNSKFATNTEIDEKYFRQVLTIKSTKKEGEA